MLKRSRLGFVWMTAIQKWALGRAEEARRDVETFLAFRRRRSGYDRPKRNLRLLIELHTFLPSLHRSIQLSSLRLSAMLSLLASLLPIVELKNRQTPFESGENWTKNSILFSIMPPLVLCRNSSFIRFDSKWKYHVDASTLLIYERAVATAMSLSHCSVSRMPFHCTADTNGRGKKSPKRAYLFAGAKTKTLI